MMRDYHVGRLEQVLAALPKSPSFVTSESLAERFGMSRLNVYQVISRLKRRGLVECEVLEGEGFGIRGYRRKV